jgi:glycosyltransferase involved in cell wall biosynthesis
MKILVLTSTYARRRGDTEPRFVDNLCRYLAEASPGNEIHVVAPHAPGIPTREVMDGIPVFRFRYAPGNWQTLAYEGGILPSLKQNRLRILLVPFFLCSQLLLGLKLARANHYDVIHAHWIIPQGLVAVILRALLKSRPPVVLTSHGGDLFALRGGLLQRLKSWIIAKSDHLTVVSSTMRDRALDQALVSPNKVSVIPMGVDSQGMFRPPEDDRKRRGLLFVGRLVDKKGIEYLIEAMPDVLQRHPGEILTIIGEGPLREALQDACRARGIADNVVFPGSLVNQEIPEHLKAAAVTVFPSVVTESGDQEGTPVAIMEALACANAVVVSDYPGARDIIEDGRNGLLVAQKSPDELAGAILSLLDTPERWRQLGEAGRETVEQHYDWRVISERFLSEFRTLTGAASGNTTK